MPAQQLIAELTQIVGENLLLLMQQNLKPIAVAIALVQVMPLP